MTIQVTKEPINLREKLNELETNKGLKGNEILQAETAQEVRSLIGAGRKNLIINGGFDVWQRGTSFTNPSSNTYMADRFFTAGARVATTITKNTGVSVNGKVVNTLRIDATGADTWDFYQGIEDYQTISGQEVTISFWYKTNLSGVVCRHYSTGTYGSPLNSDSTWNKFEVTVTLPTLVGAGGGANKTSFGWWAASGGVSAGSFLEIANFQLELGSVATDFEHRSYGEELALCQRYYQSSFKTGNVPGVSTDVLDAIHVVSWGDGNCMGFPFQGGMRASPTVVLRAQGSTTVGQVSSSGTARTASALNTGDKQVSFLQVISGTANTYNRFTWTADAEL